MTLPMHGRRGRVRDARNTAIAAIGVSGPDFRFSDPQRIAEIGEVVKIHATNISRELGAIAQVR